MDISSLANGTTALTSLSNLILVSPQRTVGYVPQRYPTFKKDTSAPLDAFLFHYEGEQSINLTSDITDHYIENNEVVNDQISLKPEIITTQGFVGELNNVVPVGLQTLKSVANKLVAIGAYTPQLSESALIAYNEAAFLYNVGVNAFNSSVASAESIANGFTEGDQGITSQGVINGAGLQDSGSRVQSQQQKAFQKLYGYWRNRTLFTLQTPWAVFQDMAIQSIHAVQDAETNTMTTFDVTFKIMRFATNELVAGPDPKASQGRAASHAAREIDLGTKNLAPSKILFTV